MTLLLSGFTGHHPSTSVTTHHASWTFWTSPELAFATSQTNNVGRNKLLLATDPIAMGFLVLAAVYWGFVFVPFVSFAFNFSTKLAPPNTAIHNPSLPQQASLH